MKRKPKAEKKIIQMNIAIKKIDMENFVINGVFSTEDEDRHGEIVYQNWDLKNFKKNPVILNSHNYGDITEILGKATEITNDKDTKKLTGSIQFAVSQNPKAKIAFDLYAGGFASAFSVGFMPKEFNDKGDILKAELLEISLVSVPANAMALAKAKGIDVEQLYGKQNGDDTDLEGDDEGEEDDDGEGGESDDDKGGSEEERAEAERLEKEKADKEAQEKTDADKAEADRVAQEEKEAEEKSIRLKPSNILKGACEAQIEIKKKSLQRIYSAVKLVSESLKVETRQETGDRAETNHLINKTIRALKKLK